MNFRYRVSRYPLKRLYRLKYDVDVVRIKKKYYMSVPKIITCSRKRIKNKTVRK